MMREHARTTRILLVEDHHSFRQAIAFVFAGEPGFVVAQAGSLAEAREVLAEPGDGFDVAVLDLALPDGSGVDLIRDLGERDVAVLVLSASVHEVGFAEAVEAGAAGFLHKAAPLDEIVDAVRRLKACGALLTSEQEAAMLRLSAGNRMRERDARRAAERLTPREKQILQALAEGLDGKEISARFHMTPQTERTHVKNIMNKLDVNSRLQALVFAARHGLVEL